MAYVISGSTKAFANKAGEFSGNHLLGTPIYRPKREEARGVTETKEAAYLARVRYGRPRPSPAGIGGETLSKLNYVGLYLKEDEPVPPEGTEVPSPVELCEPPDSEEFIKAMRKADPRCRPKGDQVEEGESNGLPD